MVLRFVKGQFHEYQESTIGAAFLTQTVCLDDTTVKFEIWDTAGQERCLVILEKKPLLSKKEEKRSMRLFLLLTDILIDLQRKLYFYAVLRSNVEAFCDFSVKMAGLMKFHAGKNI